MRHRVANQNSTSEINLPQNFASSSPPRIEFSKSNTQTVTAMRILVVEDDAQTAALVGQALRDDGHAVDVVADGREGLKQGAVNAYDVLVVDRMLPGLDGLSIVQSLRTAGVKS